MVRLLLPALMSLTLATIYAIWSDPHRGTLLADIVGSAGLMACLAGMSVWYFNGWAARLLPPVSRDGPLREGAATPANDRTAGGAASRGGEGPSEPARPRGGTKSRDDVAAEHS